MAARTIVDASLPTPQVVWVVLAVPEVVHDHRHVASTYSITITRV